MPGRLDLRARTSVRCRNHGAVNLGTCTAPSLQLPLRCFRVRALEAFVMKRAVWMFCVAAGVALAACSGAREPDGELFVQGKVSDAIAVDNARAMAVGRDGRTFWAYLDAHRDFSLRLPVGQSYQISIVNGREGG